MRVKKLFKKYWYWILIGVIILFLILNNIDLSPLAITESPLSRFADGGGGLG